MQNIVAAALDTANEIGFDIAVPMMSEALIFREEVRDMCRADRCHSYNKSWACPPGCGTLDEMRERVSGFSTGILVETVGKMEDEFDYESIKEASACHKKRFAALVDAMRKSGYTIFPMGAGGCHICQECTYPNAPCRDPEHASPSMEAAGLWVSDVCAKCGAPYYNGKNTTTFISCILIR